MLNNHYLLKKYRPKLKVRIILVLLALFGYATKVFLASVYRKVLETSETITEIQLLWTGIATIAIIALLGCMTLVKRVIGQKASKK